MDEEQLIEEMKQAWKDSIRAGGYVNDAWRAVIEVCPVHENKSIRWKERAEAAESNYATCASQLHDCNRERKELEAERDRYKKIAEDWSSAADEAQQPDKFYEEYSERTMRAMQALLTKAKTERDELKAQLSQVGEEEVWWTNIYEYKDGRFQAYKTKEEAEYNADHTSNFHGTFPIRLPAKPKEEKC